MSNATKELKNFLQRFSGNKDRHLEKKKLLPRTPHAILSEVKPYQHLTTECQRLFQARRPP